MALMLAEMRREMWPNHLIECTLYLWLLCMISSHGSRVSYYRRMRRAWRKWKCAKKNCLQDEL
jgi:hypothetical protein